MEGIKSHLCEVAIPVMLHCVSLPCGSDIFWKLIKDEFHSADWRTRFNAGKNTMCNIQYYTFLKSDNFMTITKIVNV